jgi:hypothetical protein
MKPLPEAQLNRLLAGRDRLTQADKDAVLDRVMEALPPEQAERPGFFAPWLRWSLLGAVVLLLAAPVGYVLFGRAPDGFTARGGEAKAAFTVWCAPEMSQGRCARGGKLVFRVEPAKAGRFAALARSEAGAIIWYFTDVDLATLPANGLLDEGVVVGPEHVPGKYEVWGVFSDRPLGKSDIRDLLDPQSAKKVSGQVEVVRQPLEVPP